MVLDQYPRDILKPAGMNRMRSDEYNNIIKDTAKGIASPQINFLRRNLSISWGFA